MNRHERTYQDDLNTAYLSELLGVPPAVCYEIDDEDDDVPPAVCYEIATYEGSGPVPIHPIAPAAPPMHCCMEDCTRDSTYITTVPIEQGRESITIASCDEHVRVMTEVVDGIASGQGTWTMKSADEE